MAKVQSSGTSWMIASAVLGIAFFFTLILAIIFYTRVSGAEQAAQKDRDALNLWVSAPERSSPEMVPVLEEARANRVSAVSRINDNARWLREKMINDGGASIEEIKQRLTTAGVPEGQNLLGYIVQLKAINQNDQRMIQQLKQDLEKEQKNAQAAVTAQRASAENFEKASGALKAELDKLNREFQAYKQTSDTAAKGLAGGADAQRREALTTIAQQKSTIDQLEGQLRNLQARYDALLHSRERLTGEGIDPSLMPDGRISSVLSDSRVVYIDRGKNNRVVLGMTFEVYDMGAGVVKDDRGELRGKATLEVVNVLDNASVCRVVRRDPGREIIVGDIIANVVYDPNMKFNFYIFGDFDLDNVGQTTITDRRRIEGMINGWGGQVISSEDGKLTPETDFLVLGQEPPLPDEPRDKTDPVAIENYNKARAKYETYQNLVMEAKRLSIPVLNQNRFLTMVGYYRR